MEGSGGTALVPVNWASRVQQTPPSPGPTAQLWLQPLRSCPRASASQLESQSRGLRASLWGRTHGHFLLSQALLQPCDQHSPLQPRGRGSGATLRA